MRRTIAMIFFHSVITISIEISSMFPKLGRTNISIFLILFYNIVYKLKRKNAIELLEFAITESLNISIKAFIQLYVPTVWSNVWFWVVFYTEAATRGVLWNKVFLEISQNSQENTCARVPFLIKLQSWGLQLS